MLPFAAGFVMFFPAVPSHCAEPLENAAAYSLLRNEDGSSKPGAFPMGFVRGETAQTVQLGFSQVQDVAMFDSLVKGEKYPEPSAYLQSREGIEYYSLALPADSLGPLHLSAAGENAIGTKPVPGIGPLLLAHGPDGKPYSHPKHKTRALAKSIDLCDVFDRNTRRYLVSYVREHVRSRVGSPIDNRIARWGLDNEWEARPNYSPEACRLFVEWLKRAYQNNITELNRAWGSSFTAFDAELTKELPREDDYLRKPGRFLDWCDFQSEYFMHVLGEQMAAMREADPRKRGVVHKSTQITLEMPATSRTRMINHGRFGDIARPHSGGLYGIDMYGAGDRQAYEINYIFNCIRPHDRAPGFGVMLCEANNHGGPGHQFAGTMWRLLANGLKSMMFFTPGYVGAPVKSDWDHFSFIDRDTGRPKDKFFYAARWANMVRRTEEFWSAAVPAPGMPRIAMLVPKRDVLLSERSERNQNTGMFSYARNHRWMVFRWLREQGYWVDVLPYEKLGDDYLSAYDALVLVGAEHLSPTECETIARHVASGRVLVADTMPGYFDQHHRVLNAFAKVAGVEASRLPDLGEVHFDINGRKVSAKTPVAVNLRADGNAKVLARDAAGKPLALVSPFHGGRILLMPFELGSLEHVEKGKSLDSLQSGNAPTAGSEPYASFPGEFDIGAWLGGLLRTAGVRPACAISGENSDNARIIRIEQPYVDANGNVAVVITNRAQIEPREIMRACEIELPLPGGAWAAGLWGSAESDELHPVSVAQVSGALHRVSLPEIASAGVLYFFRKHEPLIGITSIEAEGGAVAVDGVTPKIAPGAALKVTARLFNTTGATLSSGEMALRAPSGWTIGAERVRTKELAAGESVSVEFSIIPEKDGKRMKPDWIYPLVARWGTDGKDRSIAATHVESAPLPEDIAWLLTDNANYPETHPYKKKTGATYAYSKSAMAEADPISKAGKTPPGRALLGGFGSIAGERNSFNRGGYVKTFYARYNTPKVEVTFDLKDVRTVRRVNIVSGPEPVRPQGIEVFTSEDGKTFALQKTITPGEPSLEHVAALDDIRARHVKLVVTWPKAGGTLDEVEIWGR
ncbi:beta-galactosidase [Ereboglobus luteus]|uniref:beta-galactosidase n=1 Tax=Ereboglobus luteus TaxID=1796921 RepID=UPI001374EF8C|nr:beta-galactosidase [Ereboglobus luteus]